MSAVYPGRTGPRRLAGVAFLLVPALLIWLSVAIYDKKFTKVDMVTLQTAALGEEMHPHADVKLRGVVVGEVRSISASGSGATLRLAIEPDKVSMLPANVSAQLLPTTLFGQRYVALVAPADPTPERLTAGHVITQDRSSAAVALQAVLDDLNQFLNAIKPAELSVTLTALSQALRGRGTQIGQTLVTLDSYLKQVNPDLPRLNADIRELAKLSGTYNSTAPQILQALQDFSYTGKTIADQKADLDQLYSTVTGSAQDLSGFLEANSGNIIRLSADGRPTLALLAEYSPQLPCTLRMLTDFAPLMDQVLGKGTKEPGLHVDVTTVPATAPYKHGKDKPAYTATGNPGCYPAATLQTTAKGAPGLANSAQENELVNELLAPALQSTPEELPNWSSVLVGPLYRGTEVKVK
jgi:phospholipid/cholesterol/gamma-HCH transport system substrate-binding protein